MYRRRRRACPACHRPMDEVPVKSDAGASERVEIDRCPACEGVYLEFFDGEPAALARALRPGGDRSAEPAGLAALVCPDCDGEMVLRPYLESGPEVPRCESCLAVFLTPSGCAELAAWRQAPEGGAEPSWLTRLLGWLDRL